MAGKAAIITGGGGGIGAAIGELFCREGAAVLLFDRKTDILKETAAKLKALHAGARIETCAADVSEPADVARAVKRAVEAFGGMSVLVNNAAVRNRSSIEASDIEEWKRLLSINLLGAANMCKAALPFLRKSGNASIVNVSSCYAVTGRKGMPIYDATKAALLSLTRTLAFEEAEHGVRANAICPGGTLTPFTVGRGAERGEKPEDMAKEQRSDSLLRRWARPEEIAFPALWLASDESSYMTGATIMVDGGLSIM
jgi:2-hydroxycyclohexanecarboxyl-CoA dehydrogenase